AAGRARPAPAPAGGEDRRPALAQAADGLRRIRGRAGAAASGAGAQRGRDPAARGPPVTRRWTSSALALAALLATGGGSAHVAQAQDAAAALRAGDYAAAIALLQRQARMAP